MDSGNVICFDFGTAFAKVAVSCSDPLSSMGSEPVPVGRISGNHSDFMIPSEIFVSNDHVFIGTQARRKLLGEEFNEREALKSFKNLLYAPDLPALLNTLVTPRVDPSQTLTYRKLIVLFLAHLVSLTREARRSSEDTLRHFPQHIRYVFPDWISSSGDRRLKNISELFDAALAFELAHGDVLKQGRVPLASVQSIAARTDSSGRPSALGAGAVFEPAAAVTAFLALHPGFEGDSVVAMDIGAGTTDFAGFAKRRGRGDLTLLPETRSSINVAGDVFDAALLNMIVDDPRLSFSASQKNIAWRRLSRLVRELKAQLFAQTEFILAYGDKELVFHLADYQKGPQVRRACADIAVNLSEAFQLTRRRSRSSRTSRTGIVVAGGGGSFPFLDSIINAGIPPAFRNSWERIDVAEDRLPGMADHGSFGQLSTSLGGASARPTLISIFAEGRP